MMKFKQGIIYTLITVLLSSSFGFERKAVADEAKGAPWSPAEFHAALYRSQISPARMDLAAQKLYENGINNFTESSKAKAGITNDDLNPIPNTDGAKGAWISRLRGAVQQSVFDIFKSFVTSYVIAGIGAIHKKALEENLMLTPENEKQLTEQLGNPLAAREIGMSLVGGGVTYGINFGLTQLWIGFRNLISSKAEGTGLLFKYLVSGSLMSIGSNYVQGFIVAASEEVLYHPNLFGGLTLEERGAIKLIQYHSGFGEFSAALFSHSPMPIPGQAVDPRETHRFEIFNQVAWKIQMAMTLILLHDDDLREALWSHLWGQAFLQGGNGITLAGSWLSEKFAIKMAKNPRGYWEKNTKFLMGSLVIGFTLSLLPSFYKDWGTAQINTYWSDLQKWSQYTYMKWRLVSVEAEMKMAEEISLTTF